MCVCVCVQVYVVLCKPEKETGFPGAGVSDSRELLAINVRSHTWSSAQTASIHNRWAITARLSFCLFFLNTDPNPEHNRTCCIHLIELLLYCCLWISRNKASMPGNVGAWDESGLEFSTKWILCSRNILLPFWGLCENRRQGGGGGKGGRR